MWNKAFLQISSEIWKNCVDHSNNSEVKPLIASLYAESSEVRMNCIFNKYDIKNDFKIDMNSNIVIQ